MENMTSEEVRSIIQQAYTVIGNIRSLGRRNSADYLVKEVGDIQQALWKGNYGYMSDAARALKKTMSHYTRRNENG